LNIYIDFINSVPYKNVSYHGGGNYTKKVIFDMEDYVRTNKNCDITIFVIWPLGYNPSNDEEERIFNSDILNIIRIPKIDENIQFEKNSILFLPLHNFRLSFELKKIKKMNPGLKIYSTIHGLRLLDERYDGYDALFHSKAKRIIYPTKIIKTLAKKYIYKKIVKEYVNTLDKVFTDSNYSLQSIVNIASPKFINYYYLDTFTSNAFTKLPFDNEYILFVGANRPVKNFIRALEAFVMFKLGNSNCHYKLCVTGVDENFNKLILDFLEKKFKLREDFIDNNLIIYDYVDNITLQTLYKKCEFLLYTSKSEGFGLPVLEAVLNEKPIVSSYITSIPEVAGSLGYYVNPYEVSNIKAGIEYMSIKTNRDIYKQKVIRKKEIIKNLIEFEKMSFIEEILK
jgi:hypothetical protein